MNDTTELTTIRLTNAAAIKNHALKCSKTLRAGAFDRVSQDFIDQITNGIDNAVREINAKWQPAIHSVVAPDENKDSFVTGAFMSKVERILNEGVARLIQAKVQKHPSVGKTLKP